jgi:hypothetical protein
MQMEHPLVAGICVEGTDGILIGVPSDLITFVGAVRKLVDDARTQFFS